MNSIAPAALLAGILCTQCSVSAGLELVPRTLRLSARLENLPEAELEKKGLNIRAPCLHPNLSGVGAVLIYGKVEGIAEDGTRAASDPQGYGALHVSVDGREAWALLFSAVGNQQRLGEVTNVFVFDEDSYGVVTQLSRAHATPRVALWQWNVRSKQVQCIDDKVPQIGRALGAFDLRQLSVRAFEKQDQPWDGTLDVTCKANRRSVQITLTRESLDADYLSPGESDYAQRFASGASDTGFVSLDSRKTPGMPARITAYDLASPRPDAVSWVKNPAAIDDALGDAVTQLVPLRSSTQRTRFVAALASMADVMPSAKVLVLDSTYGTTIRTTQLPDGWPEAVPVISPDGRHVAYGVSASDKQSVKIIQLTDGRTLAQKDVLDDLGFCLPFAMCDDLSLFVSDHKGIYLLNPRKDFAVKTLFEIAEAGANSPEQVD